MVFDPCVPSLRKPDPQALEDLRCDLLNLGQPCELLSVIIPSAAKVEHDHSINTNLNLVGHPSQAILPHQLT